MLPRTTVLRWRVLVDPPASGPANMARDHALAQSCAPGTGTVRFYRWDPPTLSLGRNEPVTVGYQEILRARGELGVVRRPTGGRAVIHDRELTYSVVFPARALGGVREAYAKVNEALVHGVRLLGVDAESATGGGAVAGPNGGPCFLEPATGEVVVERRKLVGSAQARIGGAVLQHGSLLLAGDQGPLLALENGQRNGNGGRNGNGRHHGNGSGPTGGRDADGAAGAAEAVPTHALQPAALAELLDAVPPWEDLVGALRTGFERALGGAWETGATSRAEDALAAGLETRYASQEWTWRR